MGIPIRLAAGVAAVVLAALVGINLASRGGTGVLASPSPSASPTPAPSPLTFEVRSNPVGLTPGTYTAGSPFLSRVSVTVPSGFEGNMGGPYVVDLNSVHGTGGVSFQSFEKVYADPCHYDKGLLNPLPGPSANDLAAALANLPDLGVSQPRPVTVDGLNGTLLTLIAPARFSGCTLAPSGFLVWELPLGGQNDMAQGERDQLWILDVAGKRLVMEAWSLPSQSGADKAAVQAILDSVRIAPAN